VVYCPFVKPQREVQAGVLDLFRSTGAYLTGHFRLTSGLHSPEYLQCARVLQHPRHAEELGRKLAERLVELTGSERIDAVASPAIGGLIIGHEVARALGARFIFAEREGGKMTLRRGFQIGSAENAVVVEDVVTTGGSTREVVECLCQHGARVLAAGSVIDRSGGTADVGVLRVALETMQVGSYAPESCPLCAQGIPVVKPGSRPI
jgi:orotate phosphoribosyltransferase